MARDHEEFETPPGIRVSISRALRISGDRYVAQTPGTRRPDRNVTQYGRVARKRRHDREHRLAARSPRPTLC